MEQVKKMQSYCELKVNIQFSTLCCQKCCIYKTEQYGWRVIVYLFLADWIMPKAGSTLVKPTTGNGAEMVQAPVMLGDTLSFWSVSHRTHRGTSHVRSLQCDLYIAFCDLCVLILMCSLVISMASWGACFTQHFYVRLRWVLFHWSLEVRYVNPSVSGYLGY